MESLGVMQLAVWEGKVADNQDDMWRVGARGPHAHGNAARHVLDNLDAEGSGQKP